MNLRSILESPRVYIAFQTLVGGVRMRELCVDLLAPKPNERILDIGCGPAYYLDRMPTVEYVGFDTDERYIDYARKAHAGRGQFFCEPFLESQAEQHGTFDGIMLMGLLHHLDDEESDRLLGILARILRPGGRVVTLDTVVHPKQKRWERALALGDRGEYVRSPEAFETLARKHFTDVQGSLTVPWWAPSVYFAMVLGCSRRFS